MYVFLYQRNQVVGAIDCCIWVKVCYEKPVADIEYNEAGREDHSGKKESWHQSIKLCIKLITSVSHKSFSHVQCATSTENYFRKFNYFLVLIRNPRSLWPFLKQNASQPGFGVHVDSNLLVSHLGDGGNLFLRRRAGWPKVVLSLPFTTEWTYSFEEVF